MTRTQKVQTRQSEIRTRLAALLDQTERSDEERAEMDKLHNESKGLESDLRAAMVADEADIAKRDDTTTGEGREFAELRGNVHTGRYIAAAIHRSGVDGAEREYNAAIGLEGDRFPMSLLVDRAAIAGDAGASQGSWVDRVFAESAAAAIGVTFSPVPAGVASFPVTTAGATGAQRGNAEAATNAAYTVTVSELKPTRNSVHTVYSIEDDARLPGLEAAIVRDFRAAVMDAVDKAIFVGDAGAAGTDADITGLQGHGSVTEKTITQANKVLGTGVLAAFASMVDGEHAGSLPDLRTVLAVGAHTLWASTIPGEANGGDMSIAQTMRANGINFMARGGIQTGSGNGNFGAFVGLGRGIAGAAVAPVWESGQLIRDPYSDADSGEVRLTLHYLWNFALPRPASFNRIKFVS